MDWRPKDWTWAPRLDEGVAWLCRTTGRALLFLALAILNPDRWKLRRLWTALGWLPRNYVKTLCIAFLIISPIWLWLTYEALGAIVTLTGGAVPRDKSEDLRNIAWAFGITITALAGLLAAPLILIRAWVHERQTTAAEEGLITDRFTRAVEQLGAEKTIKRRARIVRYRHGPQGSPVSAIEIQGEPFELHDTAEVVETGDWETIDETVPNLEVRLGAIYALERIAQDSERDHIPIMETLCAYIRQNAPAREAQDHGLGDWEPLPDNASDEDREAHRAQQKNRFGTWHGESKAWTWAQGLGTPRADIQAALTVIGRRPEERIAHERRQRGGGSGGDTGFRLDLRAANLQRADVTGLDLAHALLTGTRLEGAILLRARLERADLRGARIEGAYLSRARLERANLWQAQLEGARLLQARLEGTNLAGARLEAAYLGRARLERANLRRARLEQANLWQARLEGADLSEARLEGANLRRARLERANLRRAHLGGAHLGGARLERADLGQARLEGADFRLARLEGANLGGADFVDAKNMTQDHVNAAWGDSGTILPEGIAMPDHWDDDTIGLYNPDPKYKAWLDAGAPPGKPRSEG
jgi:uncharacterized protein YjbI with pentapeptide repeats